jgi:hypothetical protein
MREIRGEDRLPTYVPVSKCGILLSVMIVLQGCERSICKRKDIPRLGRGTGKQVADNRDSCHHQ